MEPIQKKARLTDTEYQIYSEYISGVNINMLADAYKMTYKKIRAILDKVDAACGGTKANSYVKKRRRDLEMYELLSDYDKYMDGHVSIIEKSPHSKPKTLKIYEEIAKERKELEKFRAVKLLNKVAIITDEERETYKKLIEKIKGA